MPSLTGRFRKPCAACGFLLVVLLQGSAAAGTDRCGQPSGTLPADRAVRLQIRISEAKRKSDSIRYYRSAARRRKKEGRVITTKDIVTALKKDRERR